MAGTAEILNKWSTAAALLSMAILGPDPREYALAAATFVSSVAVMILSGLVNKSTKKGGKGILPFALVVCLAMSLPVARSNGVSYEIWLFRGAVPFFTFLIFYFFAFTKDANFLFRFIILSCLAWACKVFIIIYMSDTFFADRYTTVTKDLLLPFNIIGIALLLFYPSIMSSKFRWTALLAMMVMTGLAGYRSQFAIVFVLFAIFILRELSYKRAMFALVSLGAGAFGFFYFLSTRSGEFLLQRMSGQANATADYGRMAEIEFAWDKFLSSPLYGVGLGTPIPPSVTFAGREAYLAGLFNTYGTSYHVTYMHNVVMYCLMSIGLVGTIAYFGTIFFNWGPMKKTSVLQNRFGVLLGLVALIAFNLVAATFTLLQWQVMVACLSAVAATRFVPAMHTSRSYQRVSAAR